MNVVKNSKLCNYSIPKKERGIIILFKNKSVSKAGSGKNVSSYIMDSLIFGYMAKFVPRREYIWS